MQGRPVPSDLYEYSDGKRPSYSVLVNGKKADAQLEKDGYYTINRAWKKGDVVSIHFDMDVRTVRANNKVVADRGQIAVERGPLVYCAEWPDNNFDIMGMLVNQSPAFATGEKPMSAFIPADRQKQLTLFKTQDITTLSTNAQLLAYDKQGRLTTQDERLTLIPYFAWCHRGSGNMKVWMPQDVRATRPATPPSLASQATIASSTPSASMKSIADGLVPADENDRSMPYFHWWPKQGTTEWITYSFQEPKQVSSATVYWYDDQPWGGCKIPESWNIEYQDAQGQWQPVADADCYPVKKGQACTVHFAPVKTKVLRLNVKQPEKFSCGLFEWSVK